MTNQRIIYQNDDGSVAIIIPAQEALETLSIEQIALKDVPNGKPYKIVTTDDIPSDRTFRGAWEVDAAILTDGVGADYGVGSGNYVDAWDENGNPILRETQE
jgi:hypothetical protein